MESYNVDFEVLERIKEGRSKQMDVFTLATNRKSNREFAKREVRDRKSVV